MKTLDEIIAEKVKAAYEEGWMDGSAMGMFDTIASDWDESDAKRELDELDLNPDCTRGEHDL